MSEELDPVSRLVEQFQAGVDTEESFRGIFQLHHFRVEAFFRRKGFSEEESRDLTQETFFRVFKSLSTFRRDSSMMFWLFGIMQHVYQNELRRRRAEKRDGLEVSLDMPADDGGPLREPVADGEDAVSRLIGRERSQALATALQELPEQMRLCCILRYEKGYKYQEIARLMGISIETVKTHLHQGRKRLTAKLGGTDLS
jgi:RNA polymerase sigma-70 factor (ECF subfamily)